MEVHLNDPDLQAKVDQWVAETGRSADELVEEAMAGYFEELDKARALLEGRYDDIKSGNVKLIPGDEVVARLRAKSAARRSPRS